MVTPALSLKNVWKCHADIDGPAEDYSGVGEKWLAILVNFSVLHGENRLTTKLNEA